MPGHSPRGRRGSTAGGGFNEGGASGQAGGQMDAAPRRTFAKTAAGVRLARLLNEVCKCVPEHPTVDVPRAEEGLNEPLPVSHVR